MEPCERHDYEPTSNELDARLAGLLNQASEGGALCLNLPADLLVGRGYEMVLSTEGETQAVTARTYYGGHVVAGAVLSDDGWQPEHSVAAEVEWRERKARQWEMWASATRAQIDDLTTPAT